MRTFSDLEREIVICNQYHVELIKDDAVVVDAGANCGIFSTFAAKNHPDCTVYAFEPTPNTFGTLLESTKTYPNIKCLNYALGDVNKQAYIVEEKRDNGNNHIGDKGVPVEMKTLESFSLPVDFLKIDAEGYEANILKGAAKTIRQFHPIIAMSAYHHPEDKIELPRLLNSIAPYDCELRHDCEQVLICKPL
jgi:FkbM family methyltransferase